ncbi:hypothetical protein [Streptomyces sp. NPDC058461]|uniref:hypothetical protein n=1 Tax=Streptomyces sp. NPDC058461 TaxID=3346509 RepID=UPI0036689B93
MIPQALPALLGLPVREDLSDVRRRGAVCVWCPEELTGESAVDLGEPAEADGQRWFPRSCRRCAAARAHDALFVHARTCEPCVGRSDECDIGRALYRLVRRRR